jgi:rhodanese-related sulfurtransferase
MKTKRLLMMMALSFFGLFSCKGYKDVTVSEFAALLATDATVQLVDVRTPEEFAEGHLPGAQNIDWKADDFLARAQAQLAAERPVLVYCRSGRRSAEAARALEGIGLKTVNLKGGILAWTAEGQRVTRYEVERFDVK